ncbi:diacylglycerol kinase family enzyme [Propionicimonas paludicola]|uniref:Diacylglycerol kinase family enzyme n=1 Tax=Propionicimonas paludicola TaxID=185243 RepID=A0A2A9CWB7_9ACTN|nr:diacylglycerol kinase family protein [Propionicimonas paludicola]PFG17930.1 diacylglycerol kinase family enzyme [Propionicimonas paludicola]
MATIEQDAASPGQRRRVAVVVNPVKIDDLEQLKGSLEDGAAAAGWTVSWHETTQDEPGESQARQAVDEGAELVCSLGGDGTVRAVASGLVGTEVPLGILPGGTGNLLARNLGLPVDDLVAAAQVALTGVPRPVDVGAVTWDDDPEQIFLVIAGMGLDARMIGEADERIKKAVGWPAYLLSGVRGLFDWGFSAHITAPGRREGSRRARTVVVGNCGQLPGGLDLMPDARLDDGLLDLVLAAPHGLSGWFGLLRELITGRGDRSLRRLRADSVRIRLGRPILAQLDGDAVGERTTMTVRVRPLALKVMVPAD